MTRRTAWLLRFAALVAAMILVTIALGWWGVAVAALAFAAVDGRESAASESGASAGLAWALMLLVAIAGAGVRPLGVLGRTFGVPGFLLPIVSILFAGALGWSSAAVGLFVRELFGIRKGDIRPDRATS